MISSSQRPLPDNTRHSQQTNIHAPGGIRTHDLSRRTACSCLRRLPRLSVASTFPSITCHRRQFLRKMWPIQLLFFRFTVGFSFLSYIEKSIRGSFQYGLFSTRESFSGTHWWVLGRVRTWNVRQVIYIISNMQMCTRDSIRLWNGYQIQYNQSRQHRYFCNTGWYFSTSWVFEFHFYGIKQVLYAKLFVVG